MSNTINNLLARGKAILATRDMNDDLTTGGSDGSTPSNDTIMNLLISFLGLAFFSLVLVALLIMLRRMRHQRMMQQQTLPQYNDVVLDNGRNQHRLTIQTADGRQSILVVNGGHPMLSDPNSPPHSPKNVPEIHITFPDEQDEHGHRKSGRVMVVRVGEATVGLEPVREEQLPAYEKESSQGFYSVDMDSIGGLKEKEYR